MDQRDDKNNQMNSILNAHYAMMQNNDTINLMQNAIASGIPTLDMASIISYFGYANSFQPNPKESNLQTKYQRLMEVIDEIGRDVRPLYAGSKGASERIRRQIIQARHLVRECMMEVDRAQRQN